MSGGWLELYEAEPAAESPGGIAVYVRAGPSVAEEDRRALDLARRLAGMLGAYVVAVMEPGARFDPTETGADRAVPCDATDGLAGILFAGLVEPASRLAERLGRSLIGPAFEIGADAASGELVAKVRTYGGRQVEEWTGGQWRPVVILLESASI